MNGNAIKNALALTMLAAGILAPQTTRAQIASLLVSDFNNDVVKRYNATTGALIDTYIPIGSGDSLVNGPQGIVFGPDGDIYLGMLYSSSTGNSGTGRINRYNGKTGAFVSTFFGGNLDRVYGMAFGPDGKLYVSSAQNHRILRYDVNTGVSEIVAQGSLGGIFAIPHAMNFDSGGNLYFSCVNGTAFPFHRVLKITAAQLAGTLPVIPTVFVEGTVAPVMSPPDDNHLAGPRGLLFGPDANNDSVPDLYLVSRGGTLSYVGAVVNAVLRYNGVTGAYIDTFVTAGSGGLETPIDLEYGPDGNLYVSHSGTTANNGIYRYNGTTGAFIDIFVGNPAATLNGPTFFGFQPAVISIAGTLTLEDCPDASVPTVVTFEPMDGSVAFSKTITPQADGTFEITALPKQYRVKIKPQYRLSKVFDVDATGGDVTGLAAGALASGDANDDNSVDVLDLDVLIQSFDQCEGDAGFISGADFNCDGCVDVFDLDILIRNFDKLGEEL